MPDKKDKPNKAPTKQDLRMMKEMRKQEELITKLNKANKEIAEKRKALDEGHIQDAKEAAKHEADITKLRFEANKMLKEQEKINKNLEQHYAESTNHIKNFLKQMTGVEKSQDRINEKFGKQLNVIGDMTRELAGWGAKAKKTIGDITNHKANPETFFGRAGQFFYKDIQYAADQYIQAQGEMTQASETWASKGIAATKKYAQALSTFGKATAAEGDVQKMSGAAAAVLKRKEAYDRLTESAVRTSQAIGADVDGTRDLQHQLAIGTQVPLEAEGATDAIADMTKQFILLKKIGTLPAKASLDEWIERTQQIGTSSVKDIKKAAKEFVTLSHIPDLMAEKLKKVNPEMGRFVSMNRHDLMEAAKNLNKELGNQYSSVVNLGVAYANLAAKAHDFGASAETAGKVAGMLLGKIAKGDTSYDPASMLGGQRLAEKILNDSSALDAMLDQVAEQEEKAGRKFDTQQRTFLKERALKLAKEGGTGFGQLSNLFGTTQEAMSERLDVVKRLTGSGRVSTQADLVSAMGFTPKSEAERQYLAELIQKGDTGKLMDFQTKQDAEDRAAPESDAQKNREAAANAVEWMKDPLGRLGDIEKWTMVTAGATTAIAAGLALSGLKGLLSGGGGGKGGISGMLKGSDKIAEASESAKKAAKAAESVAENSKFGADGLARNSTRLLDEADLGGVTQTAATIEKERTLAQKALELGRKNIGNLVTDSAKGIRASTGSALSKVAEAGKNTVAASSKMLTGAKNAIASGVDAVKRPLSGLDGLNGGALSKVTKFGLKGLGVIGTGLGAYNVLTDDNKDTGQKALGLGGVGLEAMAGTTLPGLLALVARTSASLGARYLVGDEESADWIDENLTAAKGLEALADFGESMGNWAADRMFSPTVIPTVAPKQPTAPGSPGGASSAATASQMAAPGSATAEPTSITTTLNPDGSAFWDLRMTIPRFAEAVYQANTQMSYAKPTGK
jgi:hypothetical protein